ncbi:ion channel [Candidatus Omnitrophota bacterium]
MKADPKAIEKEAQTYLAQEKLGEAHRLFKKAAGIYKSQGDHKEAALCFASAAGCWGRKSGEKTFFESANLYKEAALQANRHLDFGYASLLYKYAAINYERDGEYLNFSTSFYRSRECHRKFQAQSILRPKKDRNILKAIFMWCVLTFSYIIWGHGERPSRTLVCAVLVVLLSALLYGMGTLLKGGEMIRPDLVESLYYSTVTFTTLGYGDITPVGWCKIVAMCEAFGGMFIMPLFIVGLSRKYLRM